MKKPTLASAVAAGRQWGKSPLTKWAEEYAVCVAARMTVEDWLSVNKIKDSDALAYPNARTAAKIKASPLGKALE